MDTRSKLTAAAQGLVLCVAAAAFVTGCSNSSGPSEPEVFQTFIVDPSGAGDFINIQAALDAAASGDTVLIVPGSYAGQGNRNLRFRSSAVVVGGGTRDETIIDCEGAGRGFRITGGVDPSIRNLTVMNGLTIGDTLSGGGMYVAGEGTSPSLFNVRFRDNRASDEGGGLYCNAGSVSLSDVLFDGNTAGTTGGGMECVFASVSLSDVTFLSNVAVSGGGLTCVFADPALSGCVFWKNTAFFGGGIYCGAASPTIESCTFALNEAEEGSSLYADFGSRPQTTESILAFSPRGRPLGCESGSDPFTTRCCVFGNTEGDTLCGRYSTSMLYVDPLFCDVEAGELTLSSDSPCLPDSNQWSVLIGALGAGCGASD
jgi:predicted outer membrane repeat protein